MTLHLSHTSPIAAMQMSDRLITVSSKKYDSDSNKTLVLIGNNGIASISYCGLAYLNSTPSDNFIAKSLVGTPPPFFGRIPSFGNGTFKNKRSIDQMIYKITEDLEKWFNYSAKARQQFFWISICGWRIRKNYCEPILLSIIKKEKKERFEYIDTPDRRWWLKSESRTNNLPKGYLKENDFAAISSLPTIDSVANADDFIRTRKDCFLSIIRRAAVSSKVVGQDAISVIMPHPALSANIHIELDSIQKKTVQDNLLGPIPVTYTPWIIGNSSYLAPSVFSGGEWNYCINGINITLNSPHNNVGVSSFSSISRPPPPR